eukprot:TRINITY_DN2211_c0_g1_i1.p1 TRINITY_DN2211_c0_g1~~TRINITY_DN2211_c0_g1_i1.p1  ORF type:complete len:183 (+),score=44.50 TRINITY_DN2211_c0_g1_i1:40-549(+)
MSLRALVRFNLRTRKLNRIPRATFRISNIVFADQGKQVQEKKNLDDKEVIEKFDEIFRIAGEEEDRGEQRRERIARSNMKRVPVEQGDFSSLEERHILFGARGTIQEPVLVESVFPSRVVGCMGSEDTKVHELLWHTVKREKPLICLECGQVFKLVTPPGQHQVEREHH